MNHIYWGVMCSHISVSVSTQVCAIIYENALSQHMECILQEAGWQFGFKFKNSHVWDAFIILTFIEDCEWHGTALDVPNNGHQDVCF